MKKKDKEALERYKKRLELSANSVHLNPFETEAERNKEIALAKKSFKACVKRYFPHFATCDVPDFHIDLANKARANQKIKAFLEWGRAQAKSVFADVLLPFWLWINGIDIYLVLVGNNKDRAEQLLEDLRAEFEANPQIINDFGVQHNPGNWEAGFFATRGGFVGQALGMGQSVRGLRVKSKRPTMIVMDDCETKDLVQNPARQEKIAKWVERDLLPTMDGEVRMFLYANNRFAPNMVQIILQERHPDWLVHRVNAYDPVTYEPRWKAKYSPNYFRELEQEIGVLAAHAEYNNEPHIEGTIFKNDDIQYAPLPRLNTFKIIFGYWDVAYAGTKTSDYNAVVVQGVKGRDFWEIDCFVKQCKIAEVLDYMCITQIGLPSSVVIHWVFEAQFWNDAIEDAIRLAEKEYGIQLNIIKRQNSGKNKYDRILTLQPYYQNNRFFYNEKLKYKRDHQVAKGQLLGIEPGYKTKDDYPDAKKGVTDECQKYAVDDSSNSGSAYKSSTGNYKQSSNRW